MGTVVQGDELERLLALKGEAVVVADETITVKPFRLKQLVGVMRCVSELSDKGVVLVSLEVANPKCQTCQGIGTTEAGPCACVTKKDFPNFNFGKMLLLGGDSAIEILSIATGREVAWLEELDPVEAIKLAAAVWRINADFFTRRRTALMEALGPLWALVEAKLAPFLGPIQSSDSSPAATT